MKSVAGVFRRAGLTAFAVAAALSSLVNAEVEVRSLEERAASGSRLVFAHFMVGLSLISEYVRYGLTNALYRLALLDSVPAPATMMLISSVLRPMALTPLP
jgi:hypothetical protein